ncbi:MAG: prolipoprotein diacylglyceryl transferase [Ruminococcaceae bacterium]|nr:prolipoprotein diacylglyceryl transferase [Oscillospiraceae bacterium]
MYPYPIFFDIDLYTVFLCLGIIGAIVVFRTFSDKLKMNWKVQNLTIVSAFVGIILGYLSAVVFQAFYDIKSRGGFIIDTNTGATFYGGLIGGAAFFLAIYFGVGHFVFKDKMHVKSFFDVADIAAASIAIAHGLGRIGCLMAGCCHGKIVDAWYAVYMPAISAKAVPIQLYEALFLFALFAFFTFRIWKKQSCNLPLYMVTYGVWRFVVEYFRTDDRGSTIVDFLSPSQLIALIMIVGSVALFFGQRAIMKKAQSSASESKADE